ncbi:hypothetical protein ACNAN0_08155 [Agrilactobacillus fermenti]|uniref:hypothetical protein n=1 Tax=Agrilactobacillus fermenti TaxID=2586909 RepID=UPI001E480851|nr:hypothetical protein [Agrilactobacillus fermenti]MCD2257134.1 hypothetical protein [Agrilactobacillus fermenti]
MKNIDNYNLFLNTVFYLFALLLLVATVFFAHFTNLLALLCVDALAIYLLIKQIYIAYDRT